MKLFRFFLLLIFLTLWAFIPIPEGVAAQNDSLISVTPPQSELDVGSEFTIELLLTDGVNVNAFDLIITYNSDLLTLERWTYGDFLSNLVDVTEETNPGSFHLVTTQLATPPVSGDGVLLEITFKGLADGVSTIAITRAELADSQGNKILPAVSDGSVAVGDVDSNPATATPMITPTSTATNTTAPNYTQTPTYPGASTGYPEDDPSTRTFTQTPSSGVQTTIPGAMATSTNRPGEATAETQETVSSIGVTATSQPQPSTQEGVEVTSPTDAGEIGSPAGENTSTQAISEQEPSSQEQREHGLSLGVWLVIGFGLIILGGGALILVRRQRQKNINEDLL